VRRALLAALLLTATVLSPGTAATVAAQPASLVADPAWYRPVPDGGFVFPVARSNFFSAMHFDDGWRDPRFRFIDGKWRLVGVHLGIDIVAEKGTPILAAIGGTVENVGWTFYSGTRIGIRGTDGRYYLYAHTSEVAAGIAPGASVNAGDLLGRVGNTGYGEEGHEDEFIPHLHFGIEGPSEWENPYPALVSAYAAAVAAGRAGEERLLALANDPDAWRAEAEALYTTFGIPLP
jgi:murein DD-endopeptidase MepM/ murein hydrolase activator NlpD